MKNDGDNCVADSLSGDGEELSVLIRYIDGDNTSVDR
jgi:hypothetical protein